MLEDLDEDKKSFLIMLKKLFVGSKQQKCPACHEGKLFSGLLDMADNCNNCGQDFSEADIGDGPAFMVMSVLGFISMIFILLIEFSIGIHMLVYIFILLPLLIFGTLYMLRAAKAMMITHQYEIGNLD